MMFEFLSNPISYDQEIYDIAYNSKTLEEAHKIADEYSKKRGSNFIIGLALSTAHNRLVKKDVLNDTVDQR